MVGTVRLHGWRDEYVPGTQQAWIAQVGGKPVPVGGDNRAGAGCQALAPCFARASPSAVYLSHTPARRRDLRVVDEVDHAHLVISLGEIWK
jgi:hypothetical protein